MNRPDMPALQPDDVRSLADHEALFERAEQLVHKGAVKEAARRGRLLLGEVAGSEPQPYSVSAEPPPIGKKRWFWRCTCPYFEIYGGPCKHGLALLLLWVEAPERFTTEASLDERLAGEQRNECLMLIRESLYATPVLQDLLALEPERRKPLKRPLNLAPYEEQIAYALRRETLAPDEQARILRGILETGAGYLRVEDVANAVRLVALLAGALLSVEQRSRAIRRLLFDTLTVLEAAILDAGWEAGEQRALIERLMRWWVETDTEPAIADRLLDLILHGYRSTDESYVVHWLRTLLRQPVHANRMSSQVWRQRVVSFLLRYYESRGQLNDYLDLCWEEGEDALAARKLVERGDVKEVLTLVRQGLGSGNAHRQVASALHEIGEEAAAEQVAREGLRYEDRGRAALLAWLAARVLETGEATEALSLARQAWEAGPVLEQYHLLREAALRNDSWDELRPELYRSLEQQGESALLVEIFMDEGLWQRAATLLPGTGHRQEELTEAVAIGLSESEPADAIRVLFELAELRSQEKSRPAYARAAQAILAAYSLAGATGQEALYQSTLQRFLADHARQSALKDELAKQGIA